jgi:release factor glutamine methyltransferase
MPEQSVWQRISWKLMPATPVGRALVSATERLRDAGISSASLDAQVILAHVIGVERSWLFAHHDYALSEEQTEQFVDCIARRAMHEPVAYLVGRKEFYGLDLVVDHRVLIPRPETELLVDAVIDHVAGREQDDPVRVADIGTGSAAIALAVAHNCPQTRVYAVDISVDALEVARANIARLDEHHQVQVLVGDLLNTLPEPVDVIVANLPYIKSFDYARLDPTVLRYEPQLALEAGPDGLDAIRRLLEQAPAHLREGGVIVLEIAHDQGRLVIDAVEALLPQAKQVELKLDYAGLERLVMIVL